MQEKCCASCHTLGGLGLLALQIWGTYKNVYRAMAWIGLYMQLLQKLAISHYSSLMRYIQMTSH